MAYIDLKNDMPGIRGLMTYRQDTAAVLNALAEILLRDDNNSLSRGERELIGSYVSHLNSCVFCENVHGAIACYYSDFDNTELDTIKEDFASSSLISEKLKTLLAIAQQVQRGGRNVSAEHIAAAKAGGATDLEIHDTVLIAASFCMFNRYVDGLGTWAPADHEFYSKRAPMRAEEGYLHSHK
jgi:uncharacterized peroxidase-related enzyme